MVSRCFALAFAAATYLVAPAAHATTPASIGSVRANMSVVSDAAIQSIVRTIVRETGTDAHPVIASADFHVPHAMAELDDHRGGEPVARIKYNPSFLQQMERETDTRWAVWGILLHELGHHAHDHTAKQQPHRHLAQLDADEFAGYWLARLGAPLDESVAVFEVIESRWAPPPPHPLRQAVALTRPQRGDRVASVTKGWHAGRGSVGKTVSTGHAG